ncbi:LLM class flavin-dependent oxidoreductase [Mesorhizobium sp. BAC0120]|uniref:LLM class flavin-dependent oxidoreductase n=1 Tax=Mesorhizobium sp. BAC0120 TaxID=3090670 RepID=UPI00298CACB4|nr:LLM class flavin-dependent oxidoreductase [Mesorhizobium sp. BAC0120]MDW6026249.1 LLM class flavin-dependent oxidoreductase [Mesorhizobium sp. BAC0120]
MRIEFTVDIPSLGAADREGRISRDALAELASAAEAAGFDRLLIAEKGGAQDAATLASCVLNATSVLGLEVEHRAGSLSPEIAARQIATLDQLSSGRITVRMEPASCEAPPLSHEESLARLDEYVVLLKRLWSNNKPIDYEGTFHRLKAAFSGAKPFNGSSVPLALAGASGTAVKIAARHADLFVLPAATMEETRRTIERVRVAASCHRRADTIRFALPVRWSANRYAGFAEMGSTGAEAAVIPGAPEKAALTLLDYRDIGVTDFIVTGLSTARDISAFGSAVAPMVRRALAHRGFDQREDIQARSANVVYAHWGRYSA